MKCILRTAVLLSLSLLTQAGAWAEGVPVIGADRDGKQQVVTVSEENYVNSLKQVLTRAHESSLATLQAANSSELPATKKSKWMLRELGVGIGIEIEIGLGRLVSLAVSDDVYLIFSNTSSYIEP